MLIKNFFFSFLFYAYKYFACMCCVYEPHACSTQEGHKRALDLTELESGMAGSHPVSARN